MDAPEQPSFITKYIIIPTITLFLLYIFINGAYLQYRKNENEIICKKCDQWFKESGHYRNGIIFTTPRGICPTCKKEEK